MFGIGDVIIYSSHGICYIDDICEKTYLGVTKKYYVLHPLEDCKLRISTPVDNDKVTMLEILTEDEAHNIIESFKLPGVSWIEFRNQRNQIYSNIIKTGNREEISRVVNTLMRKKIKVEINGLKVYENDKKLLNFIQNILFTELAFSLNTTFEEINEKITTLINQYDY